MQTATNDAKHSFGSKISFAILASTLMLSSGLTLADDVQTPTSLTGGKVITVEEGKKLLDSKKAVFIDTRNIVNFGKGHVPGAITASYKEKSDKTPQFDAKQDSFDLDKLPKDKSVPVIFYSDGPTGWKSYKAAVVSVGAGYKQVNYMRGGYADWTSKNFPVEQ